jgi:hypothetical protein
MSEKKHIYFVYIIQMIIYKKPGHRRLGVARISVSRLGRGRGQERKGPLASEARVRASGEKLTPARSGLISISSLIVSCVPFAATYE